MNIFLFPIEIFAEIDGKWRQVIGLSMPEGRVLVDYDGEQRLMLRKTVLECNFLWPRGAMR